MSNIRMGHQMLDEDLTTKKGGFFDVSKVTLFATKKKKKNLTC
jgi:hypothetical protein